MRKFGHNSSSSQLRRLFFSNDFRFFCWKSVNSAELKRVFPIDEFRNIIYHGRNTENFKRFPAASLNELENSFSIVLSNRTIDLEANNQEDKIAFLDGLKLIFRAF